MTNRIKKILPVLLVFLMVSLACQLSAGRPTPLPPPEEPLPSQPLEPTIIEDPAQGTLTVTLTEGQLTAYLIQQLEANPDAPLRNPRIVLKNGRIELFGEIQQSLITANLHMVFTVDVDAEGRLSVETESADVGNVPVPASVLDQLTKTVNQNLNDSLAPEVTGMKIQSVIIGDGAITITGTRV